MSLVQSGIDSWSTGMHSGISVIANGGGIKIRSSPFRGSMGSDFKLRRVYEVFVLRRSFLSHQI